MQGWGLERTNKVVAYVTLTLTCWGSKCDSRSGNRESRYSGSMPFSMTKWRCFASFLRTTSLAISSFKPNFVIECAVRSSHCRFSPPSAWMLESLASNMEKSSTRPSLHLGMIQYHTCQDGIVCPALHMAGFTSNLLLVELRRYYTKHTKFKSKMHPKWMCLQGKLS